MSFFSSVLTLFLIQDPIGNIPVCFSLLRQVPQHRRVWLIIRENLIALGISSLFLISGKQLLHYLHITTESLGIAGGCILFVVAFQMIFPPATQPNDTQLSTEPFIVPLAVPLLAGPSMMAMITLYGSQYPLMLCFLALCVVTLLSTFILLLAVPLQSWIKPQLLQAFERLMGVLLITMAIQMTLDSLKAYFTTIG